MLDRFMEPFVIVALIAIGLVPVIAAVTAPAQSHDPTADNVERIVALETQVAALTQATGEQQATIAALTQHNGELQAAILALGGQVEQLENAPAAEIAWPRHMMFRLDPLSDPYEVACQTTVDQAVRCDPTEKVRQLDEDPKLWDNGVCLNGTLAMVAEVPTYTPLAGFDGPDACTADVSDGGGYAIETKVTVEVKP